MGKVLIWTDGACEPNPGKGGWAFLMRSEHEEVMCGGYEAHTTNNRMEMMAAIMALRCAPGGSIITVYTDSQYLRDGAMRWMAKWKKRDWLTKGRKGVPGQPVKNDDLWKAIDLEMQRHVDVYFEWVRGHSGNENNERVDSLSVWCGKDQTNYERRTKCKRST